MPLLLEIVTPDAKVFSETVDEVGLPTSEGRMHILPHHVPVIAKLKAGEIKVHRGNDIEMLAVGSGFIEVYGDKVSILTDQAINVEKIDDTEIEEAVKRAKEALEEGKKSNIDAAEIDRLEAEARFAFAKQIARAKRR
ncbi:MAG: ATP synthase F1 subunit epsilon [Opitutae bacterium]|jgi:F-type H+-transporting ATPase subunit epsilon|nr:ATP synthase F1 subunit epsilon [Opitutae bacterium]|tara:strand:+ start:11663 stop:12076 length:414 start_codon:yes stop_codon:yes gene_type:complete